VKLDQHPLADRFAQLDPMLVLDAVEGASRRATGRFLVLNSYENRVYQHELEDGTWVVGKFYRPGRWSPAALEDEHDFLFDLDEGEVPVCLPMYVDDDEHTIGTLTGPVAGIHYALFPRVMGRVPHDLTDAQLITLGELIGRLHAVGAEGDAPNRPVLDVDTYGWGNLAALRETGALPSAVAPNYIATVEALLARIEPMFRHVPLHRIHGDCHAGNLLWTPDGPVFFDFDDLVIGPATQDVWMLVPDSDADGDRRRQVLLEGYAYENDFDPDWLKLVEPLRALRYIHYATWIARRQGDPIFRKTFEWFGTVQYWEKEVQDLREQIARVDHILHG
jgi:Ser/Thr protein kinase RdoA (MazF antagonist)